MNCKTRINKVIDFPVEFFLSWSCRSNDEVHTEAWILMGSDEKNIICMETNSKSKKDCFGYRYPTKKKFVMEKNDRDFKLRLRKNKRC